MDDRWEPAFGKIERMGSDLHTMPYFMIPEVF